MKPNHLGEIEPVDGLAMTTTQIMRALVESCESDSKSEEMLRSIASRWVERLSAKELSELGYLLLQFHVQEQKQNLKDY